MAAPKRTPEQRERDLETTARMYCRGSTMQQIGDYLEVDRSQIGYDWKIILGRWRENAKASVDEKLAIELGKINELEGTAWRSWESSLRPKEATRKQRSVKGDESTMLAETRSENRDGDCRFLDRVAWCIEQRLKIIGAYAPVKFAGTVESTNGVSRNSEFLALVDRIRARAAGGNALAPPGVCPDPESD